MLPSNSKNTDLKIAIGASPFAESIHRLKQNRLATTGVVLLFLVLLLIGLSPWLCPFDPNQQNIALGPTPPSAQHWFGTDTLGRDLFSRTLNGGKISIAVGLAATAVSLTIGVFWGATAGFIGGWIDSLMMRIVDILYSLPFMMFVILLMTLFEKSLILLFAAIGFVEWLTLSRIVRAQIIQHKTMAYVDAARCLGVSGFSIIFKHLLPNLMGPVIVFATLTIPSVMLLESSLSFLGLGIQPPASSWGTLINEGAEKMVSYPWLLVFPSLLFSITLISLNFIGDGLRDAMDPKSSS